MKSKAIIASYVGVLFFAGLLFLAAGRIAYWQGLLYLVVSLAGATLSHLLVPAGSTITVDRVRDAEAGQPWDKQLLKAYFLVNIVTFLIAGLDSGRFRWTRDVPMAVCVAGVIFMLLGQILFAVAKRENAFFSSTVRLQTERGHQVCDTGVYRVVRHPGYVGMLLSQLAFPLVLTAYRAFIPAALGAALLVARTVLEDRFLIDALPGYAEYANRARNRLLPGLF